MTMINNRVMSTDTDTYLDSVLDRLELYQHFQTCRDSNRKRLLLHAVALASTQDLKEEMVSERDASITAKTATCSRAVAQHWHLFSVFKVQRQVRSSKASVDETPRAS